MAGGMDGAWTSGLRCPQVSMGENSRSRCGLEQRWEEDESRVFHLSSCLRTHKFSQPSWTQCLLPTIRTNQLPTPLYIISNHYYLYAIPKPHHLLFGLSPSSPNQVPMVHACLLIHSPPQNRQSELCKIQSRSCYCYRLKTQHILLSML